MKSRRASGPTKSPHRSGPGRPRSGSVDRALREAARAEFVEHGYRTMSMESIAARAGVSKVSLYRRWPSKARVAAEVLSQMAEDSPMPDAGSLKADLRALIAHTIGSPEAKAAARMIMRTMGEIADDPDLMALYRERVLRPRLDQARGLVRRARARGELRRDLPADLAAALVGGPLFLYYLALLAEAPVDLPADPAGDLTKLILHGIARGE
jgi:AcrR family transcriptional regulator